MGLGLALLTLLTQCPLSQAQAAWREGAEPTPADRQHGWLRGEVRWFQVPGCTGLEHNPIDSDLMSLLEAPLDGPSEGDNLQGEEAGCQWAGLLLAARPPGTC